MRERGFSNVATILVALAAALLVAPLFMSWAVINVQTTGPDAVHIKFPVPIALVRAVLVFVPAGSIHDQLPPEVKQHKAAVLATLSALEASPDGTTFVTVKSPDARVRITKQNKSLTVDVDAEDATVRCRVPVDGLLAALKRWDWEHVQPRLASDVLAHLERGTLVHVDSPDAKVSIDIW